MSTWVSLYCFFSLYWHLSACDWWTYTWDPTFTKEKKIKVMLILHVYTANTINHKPLPVIKLSISQRTASKWDLMPADPHKPQCNSNHSSATTVEFWHHHSKAGWEESALGFLRYSTWSLDLLTNVFQFMINYDSYLERKETHTET